MGIFNFLLFMCYLAQALTQNNPPPQPVPALEKEFPYHVAIQEYRAGSGTYVQHGSGVILDDRHVLTATIVDGGAAPSTRYRIVAGTNNLSNLDGEGVQIRNLSNAVWHPDRCYQNSETINNNLEVLTLAQPLIFSEFVQPAVLPEAWHVPTGLGTITGWISGSPDLHKLPMPILSYDECFTFFGHHKTRPGRICSAFLKKEDGSSYETDYGLDRGHPVTCHDAPSGTDYVCGIYSFSTGKVETDWNSFSGYPIVSTNVAYHLDWIRAEVTKP
ncbi:trypsin-1 [Folsomia candida]|uniref:Trypsin-1 n=1 Tax=Folsomia candida TaxID=158441 RepID=A0A226DWR7_FOLCA|nr:trypsin-1 [Folsomia candida]OXA49500.1 Trypsin-1 [Folsomia candida]